MSDDKTLLDETYVFSNIEDLIIDRPDHIMFADTTVNKSRLVIPIELQSDPIISAIRKVCNNVAWHRRAESPLTRQGYRVSVERLIAIAMKNSPPRISETAYWDYIQYLQSGELIHSAMNYPMKLSESKVNQSISNIYSLLHQASVQPLTFQISDAELLAVQGFLKYWKKPDEMVRGSAKETLESVFDEGNNIEIWLGLKQFCSEMLIKWNKIRVEFQRQMPETHAILVQSLQEDPVNSWVARPCSRSARDFKSCQPPKYLGHGIAKPYDIYFRLVECERPASPLFFMI